MLKESPNPIAPSPAVGEPAQGGVVSSACVARTSAVCT